MKFIKLPHIFSVLVVVLSVSLWTTVPSAAAQEADEETADLFTAWQEQPSTATRAPKPLSQTAENTTIITRNEIEALNAHTLADVLAVVSGVQAWTMGGPGAATFTYIKSPSFYHVLVMVDGIPLNSLGENLSDVASVPAQIIDRIEIIKGAASSAWGQALGGVINVITKSPGERKIGGSATASLGEGTTSDSGGELTGKVDRLGYYFSGGYLGFRNIPPHKTNDSNNGYAKLTYDLPDQGQLWGTFRYSHSNRLNLYLPGWDQKEGFKFDYMYASLGMRRKLSDSLELEILGRYSHRAMDTFDSYISHDGLYDGFPILSRENVYGGSAKLVWRGAHNLLVLGGDYEHAELSSTGTQQQVTQTVSRQTDRWGVYLNDTITLGNLSIIPGVRFDRPRTSPDQFSPSLGITYPLGEKALLRGYTGRGYGLWALTFSKVPVEKVWTSQIGVETSLVPYLWQKLTLFRNETWNIGGDSRERDMALGAEYEIRTAPVFNTSLGAGYTFTVECQDIDNRKKCQQIANKSSLTIE